MNTGAVEHGAPNQETRPYPIADGDTDQAPGRAGAGLAAPSLRHLLRCRHNAYCKGSLRMRSLRLRTTGTHAGSLPADSLFSPGPPSGPSSASAPPSGHLLSPPNTQWPFARMSQRQVGTRGWWAVQTAGLASLTLDFSSKFCQKVEPWRSPSPSLGVGWRLEVFYCFVSFLLSMGSGVHLAGFEF